MVEEILSTMLGLSPIDAIVLRGGIALANELIKPTATCADSEVLSDTPGRLRLRLASVKGAPATARRTEVRLLATPGVRGVEASSTTGSVLVSYDPARVSSAQLLQVARRSTAALRIIRSDESYSLKPVALKLVGRGAVESESVA